MNLFVENLVKRKIRISSFNFRAVKTYDIAFAS